MKTIFFILTNLIYITCYSQSREYNEPQQFIGKQFKLKNVNNQNFFTRFDLVKKQIVLQSYKRVKAGDFIVSQVFDLNDTYGNKMPHEYVLELQHAKRTNLYYHYKAYMPSSFELEMIDSEHNFNSEFDIKLVPGINYDSISKKYAYTGSCIQSYNTAIERLYDFWEGQRVDFRVQIPNKKLVVESTLPVYYRENGVMKSAEKFKYTLTLSFNGDECHYTISDIAHVLDEGEDLVYVHSQGKYEYFINESDKVMKRIIDQLIVNADERFKLLILVLQQ